MYFLIERANGGQVKIVENFEQLAHKMVFLEKYLRQNNIRYIEYKDEMDGAGTYCVPDGVNKYKVYNMVKEDDGYIFYGSAYEAYEYDLEIVFYKLKENGMIEIVKLLDL